MNTNLCYNKTCLYLWIIEMYIEKEVSPASACFPGKPLESSIHLLNKNDPKDICIEKWDFSHVQLCPQHIGYITEASAEKIAHSNPSTQFRLHANVRVFPKHQPFDSGNSFIDNKEYITQLKVIQQKINAKYYSYHAPMRGTKTWEEIYENISELQDFLNIPVAIEGLYPNKKIADDFWEDSYSAYETILNKNLFFALDLSHLNIAYEQSNLEIKEKIKMLAKEMISNSNCLEIHISDNDGIHDSHKVIQEEKWWLDILNNTDLPHNCVIFCESLQSKS